MKFSKYYKVTFAMKGGRDVVFKCSKITIKKSGHELVAYEVFDVKNGALFFCNLDEIQAITYVLKFGFWS